MRCYFIRHGQSENNLLYETTGSNADRSDDPLLTSLGVQQAQRAGAYLRDGLDYGDGKAARAGFGITHIYSSFMVRAIGTATEISKTINIPVTAWYALHEQGGIYLDDKITGESVGRPGKQGKELMRLFPDLIFSDADLYPTGWWNCRPRESKDETLARARIVLKELFERHGGSEDRILLVSHAAFYNSFVEAILKIASPNGHWFSMNNTGISRFNFETDFVDIIYHNYTGFLDLDQIT